MNMNVSGDWVLSPMVTHEMLKVTHDAGTGLSVSMNGLNVLRTGEKILRMIQEKDVH